MRRTLARAAFVLFLSCPAFGQSTETRPTFDVADVHPSTSHTIPVMTGGVLRLGRYELRNATMVDLIKTAYGVDDDRVIGGPSWLETDRFDVITRTAPTTTPEALKIMLQNLLADRFALAIHKDAKSIPVFVLSVGKGRPKLKEASGSGHVGCEPQPLSPPPSGVIPYIVVTCRNLSMADFAETLHQMASGFWTTP